MNFQPNRTFSFQLGTRHSLYRDGYQYETKPQTNGGRGYAELLFFPTAEGYVKALYKDDQSYHAPAAYQYVYIYKDHLGNNRLSYTLDPKTHQIKILEENHYYPFGLKHGNYNAIRKDVKYKEQAASKKEIKQVVPEAVKFKYLYNSKELQDELGLNVYDYGARTYDPAAPRFWQVDPLAEKYIFQSVYVYADDNPVRFMDIDGKGTEDNFIFDTKGNLIERVKNDSPDRFFVRKQIQKKILVTNSDGTKSFMTFSYSVNKEITLNSDTGYMARIVYAEAAGQSKESKLAVAEVIRNRADDKTKASSKNKYMAQFSNVNSFKEVANQPNQFQSVSSKRFTDPLSVTGGDGKNKRNESETKALSDSFGAAINVTNNNTNTTNGATYFFSPYISTPYWVKNLKEVKVSNVNSSDFKFYKYENN